jgi:hypothetical protein
VNTTVDHNYSDITVAILAREAERLARLRCSEPHQFQTWGVWSDRITAAQRLSPREAVDELTRIVNRLRG